MLFHVFPVFGVVCLTFFKIIVKIIERFGGQLIVLQEEEREIKVVNVGEVEKISIENPNKRYALIYYQHAAQDYQNYTVQTNGKLISRDEPIDDSPVASPYSGVFRHRYRDGMLIVDITNATWVRVTYHIARPDMPLRKRVFIIEQISSTR